MATIYVPRQIVPLVPRLFSPLFFLAGPIRGGGDWQAEMCEEIIPYVPDAHIACPCRWSRTHRLAPYLYQPFGQAMTHQLEWERHYLKQAGTDRGVPGCVIFWLGQESIIDPHPGPGPYAQDTRREVGKFTGFHEVLSWFPLLRSMLDVRIVFGGDRDFYGLDIIMRDLKHATGKPVPFYPKMRDVVAHAFLTSHV